MLLDVLFNGVTRVTQIMPYHKGLINGSRYLQDVLFNGVVITTDVLRLV